MANTTAESLAAHQYINALRELLASGRYIIAGKDGRTYNLDLDRDRILGYAAPDGSIYLLPKIARQAVERLLGPDGLGDITPTALYRQLDDLGFIASKGKDGTLIVDENLAGKSTRMLHLTREAITGAI